MIKQKHITIDASILILPDHSCSQEDVFNYIETLIELNTLLNSRIFSSTIALYYSIDTACLTINEKEVTSLLKYHHIKEFDSKTLVRFFYHFLGQIKFFEDFYQLNELKYDQNLLNIKPNILDYFPFRNQIDTAMISLAVVSKSVDLENLNHFLFIKKLLLKYDDPKKLYITHPKVEYNELETHKKISLVNDFVPILDNIKDILQVFEYFDICNILRIARDVNDIKDIIKIYLIKNRCEHDIEDILSRLKIGVDFLESCHIILRQTDVCLKIIKAIVDSLMEVNMSKTHALRIDSHGGSPPIIRYSDKAKALRRDIDNEFHLHYWQKEKKEIELSKVVVHNDFTIS